MTDLVDRPALLPLGSSPVPVALVAVDGRLDDIDTAALLKVKDVDDAASGFLPYLAWEVSVDVWRPSWSDDVKRAVIKASPVVKRHKGTRYAVEQALSALGVTTELVEWWEASPKGVPYTFEVKAFATARLGELDGPLLSNALISDVYSSVLAAKPVSRAFSLRVIASIPARLGLAPVAIGRSRCAVGMHPAPIVEDFPARLGLAPVAVGRSRSAVGMHPNPVSEDFPAALGLAPVAIGRSRCAVGVHFAPVVEDFPATLGVAMAAVGRVRVSVLLIASP